MSRIDNVRRSRAGMLAAECLRAQPRPPQPSAPAPICPECAHELEDLYQRGILEFRNMPHGEYEFRGALNLVPRISHLIADERNSLPIGEWHRVTFSKIPGSRRKKLCLYRGESEAIQ
jgi:hypothetical protein